MTAPGEMVDMEQCQQLAKLVENLTTSGKPVLVEEDMKTLKKICRRSDAYVKHCFHLVMTQLEKEHAEIRLSSFLIVDEIFNRSHCFRDLLLKDFQNFLELTLETDPEIQLPPPKQAANILKYKAMRTIHHWHSKFGDAYKKLSLGYNFLKHCKKIDFESMEARSEAERRQAERDREKAELVEKQLVKNAIQQMKDMKQELRQSLLQAENCMGLLLPEPESFDINGLKSPDPHRASNPWQQYRRPSLSDRRKSSESNRSKNKSKRSPDSQSQQKLNKYTSVLEVSQTDVKIKTEKVDSESNTQEATLNSSQTSSLIQVKVEPRTEEKECSGSNNKDEKEGDSDDFQEITDSSEEEDMEADVDVYDEEDMLPASGAMELVRSHGLGSRQFQLSIALPPDEVEIEETEDNEDIIHALRDSVQLSQNKYLPTLAKCIEIFTKAGKQDLIRKALDIKNVISNMTEKVGKLKFVRNKAVKPQRRRTSAKDGSDVSDDDFEEVAEKEGFEPNIPEHLREEYGLVEKAQKPSTEKEWSLKHCEDTVEDPTSSSATLKVLKKSLKEESNLETEVKAEVKTIKAELPTTSTAHVKSEPSSSAGSSADLLKKAPYVPFNSDLAHWGKKIEAPLVVKFESSSRFWVPKESGDVVDKGALSEMTSRMISFTGKFEPVTHQCRAPLPNGKLCPRRDRVKCPFHGKIVARDPVGKPVDPADQAQEEQDKEKKQQEETPDWEDPDLQQEIQAATGVDVSRKKGKGKGKQKGRKKYPELTDISPQPKTSRGRLESKVLSVKAVKRVSEAMDAQDRKRHRDKFGNQFNYALKQKP